jgi:predicted transcriptional regulator
MSQSSVLELLRKNKNKWFTSDEISKYLKIQRGSVTTNLNKLLKNKEVIKKILIGGNPIQYAWKVRRND